MCYEGRMIPWTQSLMGLQVLLRRIMGLVPPTEGSTVKDGRAGLSDDKISDRHHDESLFPFSFFLLAFPSYSRPCFEDVAYSDGSRLDLSQTDGSCV
jgi:hypothetical protein